MQNNVLSLLMAIVPVFLYSFLVYFIIPEGHVSQRRARRYLITGFTAPMLVYALHYMFPILHVQIDSLSPVKVFGCDAFLQTGLVEEICKFITFWWVFSQRRSAIHDLPIATIYYCMMASAGFALVENISYLMHYGNEVLFSRAISAIVLHMICGIVMGYYIQKGFSKITMTEKYSLVEILKMKFHKWKHIITGIIMATTIHGVYDFNLSLPLNLYSDIFLYVILFFGLFIGKFMIYESIRISGELRSKNYNKDLEYF